MKIDKSKQVLLQTCKQRTYLFENPKSPTSCKPKSLSSSRPADNNLQDGPDLFMSYNIVAKNMFFKYDKKIENWGLGN